MSKKNHLFYTLVLASTGRKNAIQQNTHWSVEGNVRKIYLKIMAEFSLFPAQAILRRSNG
jgi:hypothetical protein